VKRVTGIGGVSSKRKIRKNYDAWYEKHLGLKREPHGQGVSLHWRNPEGMTAWALFKKDTKYFDPSQSAS
jgi:hypothetical protein